MRTTCWLLFCAWVSWTLFSGCSAELLPPGSDGGSPDAGVVDLFVPDGADGTLDLVESDSGSIDVKSEVSADTGSFDVDDNGGSDVTDDIGPDIAEDILGDVSGDVSAPECVDDADCADGVSCSVDSCLAGGTCAHEPADDGAPCDEDGVCQGGECVEAMAIRGLTLDPWLYPIEGVKVWLGDDEAGGATTNIAGSFKLLTTLKGPVIVHFEGPTNGKNGRFASRHLLVNLSQYSAVGADANATVTLRRISGTDIPFYEGQSPSVAFGGLHVTPVEPVFITADGASYEGPVAMEVSLFNPWSLFSFFLRQDMAPAVDLDGNAITLQPQAAFEVRARAVDEDGQVGELLELAGSQELVFSWDLDMDFAGAGLCGGGTAWDELRSWRLDEGTATWIEVAPDEGSVVMRHYNGLCSVTGVLPQGLGWWTVGREAKLNGCVKGKIVGDGGVPVAGARVDITDIYGGGISHQVTGFDGTYCAPSGIGKLPFGGPQWVDVQARKFMGEVETSTTIMELPLKAKAGVCGGAEKDCTSVPNLKLHTSCMTGKIFDADANPVTDATVFTSVGTTTTTDATGSYCVEFAGSRDQLIMAQSEGGTSYKRQAYAFYPTASCATGCSAQFGQHVGPDMTPAQCYDESDCVGQLPPVPEGVEDLRNECYRDIGECRLRIADEAANLERLTRLYRGAGIQKNRPGRRDEEGELLGCTLPDSGGPMPIEGTCCSTGGLGGPDTDADDRCDPNPSTWSNTTFSALGVSVHTQVRGVLSYQNVGDGHFEGTLASDPDCDGLSQTLKVQSVTDPKNSCGVSNVESLTLVSGGTSTTLELKPMQTLKFKPVKESLNPYWPEMEKNLEAILKGAEAAFTAQCTPPADTLLTPVAGRCCSENGLGGPDANGDNLCDADSAPWQEPGWQALGFAIPDSHAFVYAFEVDEKADGSYLFKARAVGDLDCDGVQSTFIRFGLGFTNGDGCNYEPLEGYYISYENE